MNLFKKRKSITNRTDSLFLGINLQDDIYLRCFTIFIAPIFKYLEIIPHIIRNVILKH